MDFLPEGHTDFIIAVLAEEFGFRGVSLLSFYAAILLRGLVITVARPVQFCASACRRAHHHLLFWSRSEPWYGFRTLTCSGRPATNGELRRNSHGLYDGGFGVLMAISTGKAGDSRNAMRRSTSGQI